VTTVLICDDHRIVREGLRQFVVDVPGVRRVVTAASGEEVLARYDVELSNDGFNAVSTLRILQTKGLAGVPVDLIDRFLLHPL